MTRPPTLGGGSGRPAPTPVLPGSATSQTLGEFRVGLSFNPSADPLVDALKRAAADLIDLIETIPAETEDRPRLKALAQTHVEDAAMWAVKAATKPQRME